MKMSLINNTIVHLLNFSKFSSFTQALKEAAEANNFQVVLLSEEFNPLVAVETRHVQTVDEVARRCKQAGLGSSDSYRQLEIDGVKVYWGTVEIESVRYYLMIIDNNNAYTEEDINDLAQIIQLSMGMWKFTPEHDAKAEFVKALMRGNKSLAYSIKEEAGIRPSDIISVFYAKNLNSQADESVIHKYENEGLIDIITIAENDDIYGVIVKGPKFGDVEDVSDKAVCANLYNELKENKSSRIFHITGLDGIEGAADAFKLINETWNFVANVFPYKRVFTKFELVLVSNCIAIQVQGGTLKKNYLEFLEPFRREGDNKSRQLLDTLETFVLDAGMNSSKTADIMKIHTNTVQYRLKKINELLGVEITGNRVVPGLTLALALRRLENAVSK